MKKAVSILVAGISLLGISAVNAAAITITETPVMLKKEGQVYVLPEGSTTGRYYYYTSDRNIVCTSENVASVTPSGTISVRINGSASNVNCYPANTFVIGR